MISPNPEPTRFNLKVCKNFAILCFLLVKLVIDFQHFLATLPCWAMLHPSELRCTFWAMPHLRCTPYWLAHPNWATLHPTELRCTLLRYPAPFWATQHYTMWTTPHPNWDSYSTRTFVRFFEMLECWTVRYRNNGTSVRYQIAKIQFSA
jgi:hypothetical protein